MVVMSKFHREAIITGCVDSFCLACEEYLKCEQDITTHITKPVHNKNLLAVHYVDKYHDDHIRKVKRGYYCEFCNLLLPTAARVNLHVGEATHRNNKGMQLLKRAGNNVIAYNNICIKQLSWNGLIENTCVICNTEFDNESIHKNERDHLLNLVQNKIEFDSNNNIYRKTDEASFQCLTCNAVLALENLISHFDDEEHKSLYIKCVLNVSIKDDAYDRIADRENTDKKQTDKENASNENKIKEAKKPSSIQIKKQEKALKVQPPIDRDAHLCKSLNAPNFINDNQGKKWCILCEWTMDINAVPSHIVSKHHQSLLKMHKDRMKKKEKFIEEKIKPVEDTNAHSDLADNDVEDNTSKILESISNFQQNRIKFDLIAGTAFCNVCSKNINYNFDDIENHIEEHKKKPEKKEPTKIVPLFGVPNENKAPSKTSLYSRPVQLKKKDDEESLRSRSVSSRDDDDDVETFARLNNMTIDRVGNRAVCRACDTNVPNSLKNMKQHVTGKTHKTNMTKVDIPKKPNKNALMKKPLDEFINILTTVEFFFGKDVVINDSICLNLMSFLVLSKTGTHFKLECFLCDVKINTNEVDKHIKEYSHSQKYDESLVVTSLDSEFVRELRPGLYHCGFCNIVKDWDSLQDHLQTSDHRESKTSANWRLQQHLPQIARERDVRTFASAMRLMNFI